MSLLNNALKQAEQARPKAAVPATGPVLLPADCLSRRARRGSSLPLTALMVVVMALSGFMMWKWFRAGDGDMKVRARSYDSAANPLAQPQPAVLATVVTPAPEEAKLPAATNALVEEKPSAEAAAKIAVAAEPPTPVTYKLQGIIYQPGHCSAVINGKTVCAGDRVEGGRVLRIDKDSAVIVTTAGQTNSLDLF